MLSQIRTDLKVHLHRAFNETGVTKAELARNLDVWPNHVNRLLDIEHNSTLQGLLDAIFALGYKVTITVKDIS